jgi:hypothetical protein
MFRRKPTLPVDRALRDVNQQLADLRRQIRAAEQRPPSPAVTGFVKQMLAPARRPAVATYRTQRADLFDVAGDPLRELDPEPARPARAVAPDLFSSGHPPAPRATAADSPSQQTLIKYLGAGSVRACGPHRPLKGVERRERNRFFGWIGLALAALWLLYVMIR